MKPVNLDHLKLPMLTRRRQDQDQIFTVLLVTFSHCSFAYKEFDSWFSYIIVGRGVDFDLLRYVFCLSPFIEIVISFCLL